MNIKDELCSKIDVSKNFVFSRGSHIYESRYVRREKDYLTCYLSTHSGCVKACSFCHLTQTGQTNFLEAGVNEILEQAVAVLEHYKTLPYPAKTVLFSFMARGEPMASKVIRSQYKDLSQKLSNLAESFDLKAEICISTIMPPEVRRQELGEFFGAYSSPLAPIIYYSLYSLRPSFRKKWIPSGIPPEASLDKLARWQGQSTQGGSIVKSIVIHGTLIKGENDDIDGWSKISSAIKSRGLSVRFNLVAYNPFSKDLGIEGDMERVASFLRSEGFLVQKKERVGFDVKAACGMFVDGISS